MHVTNWRSSLNSISYSGQTYFHLYETKSGVRPCSLDYKNSTTIIESHKVKILYLIKENPTSIIPIKFLSWFRPWWPNRCLLILFTLSHGSSLSYRLIRNDLCLTWTTHCLNWLLITDHYPVEVDCEKIV